MGSTYCKLPGPFAQQQRPSEAGGVGVASGLGLVGAKERVGRLGLGLGLTERLGECQGSGKRCIYHTMGHADMVVPLTKFVKRVTANTPPVVAGTLILDAGGGG
jgi:hypothetical protein